MEHYSQIRELIDRVRARWRALCALHAMMRGTLIAAVVLAIAVIASRWTAGAPLLLIVLAGVAAVAAVAAVARCPLPPPPPPPGAQGARLIQGGAPALHQPAGSARHRAPG